MVLLLLAFAKLLRTEPPTEMACIIGDVFAEDAKLGRFELDRRDARIIGEALLILELTEVIEETEETDPELGLGSIGAKTGVVFLLSTRLVRLEEEETRVICCCCC